eukprot:scaffold35639_cov129-Isochrysis_galbana.AAC.3
MQCRRGRPGAPHSLNHHRRRPVARSSVLIGAQKGGRGVEDLRREHVVPHLGDDVRGGVGDEVGHLPGRRRHRGGQQRAHRAKVQSAQPEDGRLQRGRAAEAGVSHGERARGRDTGATGLPVSFLRARRRLARHDLLSVGRARVRRRWASRGGRRRRYCIGCSGEPSPRRAGHPRSSREAAPSAAWLRLCRRLGPRGAENDRFSMSQIGSIPSANGTALN